MSNYSQQYTEVYDYLSVPSFPDTAYPSIVFGRSDPRVAQAAGKLAAADLTDSMVISGGIGKDSGGIVARGYRSEADFQYDQLTDYAAVQQVKLPPVYIERLATNGAENAKFSLTLLQEHGVALTSLIAVAHATSLRRLAAGIDFQAQTHFNVQPTIYRVPTKYPFDPANPVDQDEAVAELLRLADWPAKGLLLAQTDLPANLVDFARDVHGKAQ